MPRQLNFNDYLDIIQYIEDHQLCSITEIASAISLSRRQLKVKLDYLMSQKFIAGKNIDGAHWIYWKPPLFITSNTNDIHILKAALTSYTPNSYKLYNDINFLPPQDPEPSIDFPKFIRDPEAYQNVIDTISSLQMTSTITVANAISNSRFATKRKLKILHAKNFIGGRFYSPNHWVFWNLPLFLSRTLRKDNFNISSPKSLPRIPRAPFPPSIPRQLQEKSIHKKYNPCTQNA